MGYKDFIPAVWYLRTLDVTAEQLKGRILLHFGAVDYQCTVFVNGVDLREYRQQELREMVASILQNSELFTDAIAENIGWGDPNATAEQVKAAAVIAQADDFISTTAEGYETAVAERGMSLSGGQKQRLSLARYVLKGCLLYPSRCV